MNDDLFSIDYPAPQRRMTPDEVLAFFIALQREMAHRGELPPEEVLQFDSTIETWREACDLFNDRALSEPRWLSDLLNDWFHISATPEQWKDVLEPASAMKLRGVCQLIASQAMIEEIRPVLVRGQPSLAAGAFLAIRTMLARVGVNVMKLRPSTPLAPILRRHYGRFFIEMAKLAPGKLPPTCFHATRIAMGFGWLGLVGLAALLLCLVPGVIDRLGAWPMVAGVLMLIVGWLGAVIAPRFAPRRIQLGDLRTFDDLCHAVTDQPPSPHSEPPHP